MTRARTDTGDDRALLTAARAGDERAFACLLERHRCDLETYCYLMLGCPHAAARVVRTTALVAWRGRERAEGRCAGSGSTGSRHGPASTTSTDAMTFRRVNV